MGVQCSQRRMGKPCWVRKSKGARPEGPSWHPQEVQYSWHRMGMPRRVEGKWGYSKRKSFLWHLTDFQYSQWQIRNFNRYGDLADGLAALDGSSIFTVTDEWVTVGWGLLNCRSKWYYIFSRWLGDFLMWTHPRVWIWCWVCSFWAAEVAARMQKEWLEKLGVLKGDLR